MQFIIGAFIKAIVSFGGKLLTTLASEVMIEWAFFKIADAIAKSTATPHDDEWVQKIKQSFEDGKNK